MSEIAIVKLSSIDPNPFRQLATYPYNEAKLETLQRSIHDVGLWEGVIGRPKGNRIEIAFGHHRVEASRLELGDKASIPIIVRDLDDEQMLKFMGRENMEEYNSDFLILLETWEAAKEFLVLHGVQNLKPIDIARFLGWTRPHPQHDGEAFVAAASACASASELLEGGYFDRSELAGLSVGRARDILERVLAHHRDIDRTGRDGKRTAQDIKRDKKIAAGAGKLVASDIRNKRSIADRDIRKAVDVHAYRISQETKRPTPFFDQFAKTLTDQIHRLATDDSIGEKLKVIVDALGKDRHLLQAADLRTVEAVAYECSEASERFAEWEQRLLKRRDKPAKVVPIKQIGRTR